ncbi:polysaccharide deacetylase family protein [Halomarina salina]|uniref:Polysaccharide deacetylase family protein n=1 Tax=Halomarina salina TaxID=1872699 RepID=A0ABD5RP71_9EURY|nr:polysaccharide deacetylase family protein [Halomarina salina]
MTDEESAVSRRAFLATGGVALGGSLLSTVDSGLPGEGPTESGPSTATSQTTTETETVASGQPTDTPTETPAPGEVVPPYLGAFFPDGDLVDDMSDLSRWSGEGTVRADEAARFRGDQSLYYENEGAVRLTGDYHDDPIDLSGRALSVATWFGEPKGEQPTFSIRAHAPDRHNTVTMRTSWTGNKDARWQRQDLAVSQVDGSPDLSTVTRLDVGAWASGATFELHLADIRTHPKPETGKFVFLFDDTHRHHYDDYFPILQRYDYPAIEAVVKEYVGRGDRLTVAQIHELRDAGWDVCNHMVDHENVTELSTEELRANIAEMDAFFEDIGAPEGKAFAIYCFGAYDGPSLDVMAEHFDFVFGGGGLGNYDLTNPGVVACDGIDDNVERGFELATHAAEYQSVGIPTIHDLEVEQFERLVEHVHDLDEAGKSTS